MAIDTLIFDFDGVIIDTETPDFQTWQEIFHAHGVEFEMDWWTQFIGGSVEVSEIFQKLEDGSGSRVKTSRRQAAAALWAFPAPGARECDLLRALLGRPGFAPAVPGFGSSDCRSCPSHLLAA